MLRAMLEEIGPSSHRQFPSVRRIVAAYTVGAGIAKDESTGDICQWLFPCAEGETEARWRFGYCDTCVDLHVIATAKVYLSLTSRPRPFH